MNGSRTLRLCGYLTATFLVAAPLADTVLFIHPFKVSDLSWRYGALGMLTRAFDAPFLGLLLAMSLATVFYHRWALRALSVASGISCVLLLAGTALFTLDSIQLRNQVQEALLTPFDRSWVVGASKYMVGSVLLSLVSAFGWRMSRVEFNKRASSLKRDRRSDLVVGP